MHFLQWKIKILIKIAHKLVPKGPTDNKAALVQVMVWHQIGDKPLAEPITLVLESLWHQWASVS